MALSGNGPRASCGLTGRSLENRPLAASWPPMRDGLNGPMDENQLWFVETVSQSVSSRGPRRSAHHRLNGHTDGFAQLSNRNSRIRTIGASSLYRGVLRTAVTVDRTARVPPTASDSLISTDGSAVRSSEVCRFWV